MDVTLYVGIIFCVFGATKMSGIDLIVDNLAEICSHCLYQLIT